MAIAPEVTKQCRNGHTTTHRLTKPGKTECKTCRVPVWISKTDIQTAAVAARTPDGAGHQGTADTWAKETPFTGQTPHFHPRQNGTCHECGTGATHGTPRGTLVVCPAHGPEWDTRTLANLRAAEDRENRRRQLAAAERAQAAAVDPAPRSIAEELDIAGQFGTLRGGIASAVNGLDGAPTAALFAEATRATARLNRLDSLIQKCTSKPDPIGALSENGLMAALHTEILAAAQLARRIEDGIAAREAAEAREHWHQQIDQPREIRAPEVPAPRPPAAPAPPRLSLLDRLTELPFCGMPHRINRPAIRILTLGYSARSVSERIPLCGDSKHDPDKICQETGYTYWGVT
jgi:hypothetical protein